MVCWTMGVLGCFEPVWPMFTTLLSFAIITSSLLLFCVPDFCVQSLSMAILWSAIVDRRSSIKPPITNTEDRSNYWTLQNIDDRSTKHRQSHTIAVLNTDNRIRSHNTSSRLLNMDFCPQWRSIMNNYRILAEWAGVWNCNNNWGEPERAPYGSKSVPRELCIVSAARSLTCRDDLDSKWRLLLAENELSCVSLLSSISIGN